MKSRWLLMVLSLVMVAGLVIGGCAPAPKEAAPPTVAPPAPKAPFKVGIIAALTGPAAVNYMPATECVRCMIEDVNDRGGIDGRKIELYIEDSRGEPPRAATQAKLLTERGVNLFVIIGPSATYSGVMAECERTNIPVILGGTGTESQIPPNPNPLFFCASHSYTHIPPFLARILRVYDPGPIKVGLCGPDIPANRLTLEAFVKVAKEREGIEAVVDFVPFGTTDLTAVAAKQKAAGIKYCAYWGPVEAMTYYDCLTKLGWKGAMYAMWPQPLEDLIDAAKRSKAEILYYGMFVPWEIGSPAHDELKAVLTKYKAVKIGALSLWGYQTARVIMCVVKKTDAPVTTEKLLQVLNNFECNVAPIYGKFIWTKTDHTGPAYARPYLIHEDGKLTIGGNWIMSDSLGKTLTDLGKELPK